VAVRPQIADLSRRDRRRGQIVDYIFETLDDKRFQQLCQALTLRKWPDSQIYPLGESDGGRDAIMFDRGDPGEADTTVVQVKFTRDPSEVKDVVKWLTTTIEAERPKVVALAKRGAKRFELMTNVRGSGSLDSGEMDKIAAILRSLPIEAVCLWRADITSSLDAHPDLRLSFPEVLTGRDAINIISAGIDVVAVNRREKAVRAFLTGQYDTEGKVRFKQAEISNDLFDLFVDIPAAAKSGLGGKPESADPLPNLIRQISFKTDYVDPRYPSRNEAGAASILLDCDAATVCPSIVLEGAPGQGKSTITQLVCQIHRTRFLGRTEGLGSLPSHLTSVPLRFPIKVDLRELSSFLIHGRIPGSNTDAELTPRTLETFLSALIHRDSGGCAFDVDDLACVMSQAPSIVMLDGLDEVAEAKDRARVVDEITIGSKRLRANAKDLQVVVTSRPAAYAASPGLDPLEFRYLDFRT
jgi:hypothetical protein